MARGVAGIGELQVQQALSVRPYIVWAFVPELTSDM